MLLIVAGLCPSHSLLDKMCHVYNIFHCVTCCVDIEPYSSSYKYFIVAVQRRNAVWYLEQELKSFGQSSQVYREGIYCK